MKRTAQNRFKALASACVLSMMATVAWSQTLTWIVEAPFWAFEYGISGRDVSADGRVVVGFIDYLYEGPYNTTLRDAYAYRWTADSGTQRLDTLPGYNYSYAYGVSADGSVVVGWAEDAANQSRAFRWTQATGMQDLGTLGGNSSAAYGVSADGSVVVGGSDGRAFRWTQATGMQDLGTLPGRSYSMAWGVSADGSVVVGRAYNAAGQSRAFRWTQATGMQDLGTLGGAGSSARAISGDGSVVVGISGDRVFRWTATAGMQDIGRPSGYNSVSAEDVSADGNIVVGWVTNDWPYAERAVRWTASGGWEDLNVTYARLLTNGSILLSAIAISPDGRYIVGWGYDASDWHNSVKIYLLDTGFPRRGDVDRNGCVDDADLLTVLFVFGERGYRNEDLNWDGTIDDADLLEVLFNFGSGC